MEGGQFIGITDSIPALTGESPRGLQSPGLSEKQRTAPGFLRKGSLADGEEANPFEPL